MLFFFMISEQAPTMTALRGHDALIQNLNLVTICSGKSSLHPAGQTYPQYMPATCGHISGKETGCAGLKGGVWTCGKQSRVGAASVCGRDGRDASFWKDA